MMVVLAALSAAAPPWAATDALTRSAPDCAAAGCASAALNTSATVGARICNMISSLLCVIANVVVAIALGPEASAILPPDQGRPVTYLEQTLQERSRTLPVTVHDRIGAHIGERLDGERRIEPAHARERGAPDDEQVRHIPALPVAIDHGGLRIASHARSALVVRRPARPDPVARATPVPR